MDDARRTAPDEYFDVHTPPPRLPEIESELARFVERHLASDRRIALVTSGGTTVPMENQTVRFIDNFSGGTRGATSAEYLLEAGYAVVFLHRQFSLQPYSRHYTHSTNCFLELLSVEESGSVVVVPREQERMKAVFLEYHKAKSEGTLLFVTFVTVNEYLFTLRSAAKLISRVGNRALYYLAAAVSDFYVPAQKMVEHKIQSGSGGLNLQMEAVPKILTPLVNQWASRGFIVSFKLETEQALLEPKARQALERYGHQIVIANMLTTRKHEVDFITPDSHEKLALTREEIAAGREIEAKIIPELVRRHDRWITGQAAG